MLLVSRLPLSTRQQDRLWRHVEQIDGFWEGLNETGALVAGRAPGDPRRPSGWGAIFPDATRPHARRRRAQRAVAAVARSARLRAAELPPSLVQDPRGRIAAALGLDMIAD